MLQPNDALERIEWCSILSIVLNGNSIEMCECVKSKSFLQMSVNERHDKLSTWERKKIEWKEAHEFWWKILQWLICHCMINEMSLGVMKFLFLFNFVQINPRHSMHTWKSLLLFPISVRVLIQSHWIFFNFLLAGTDNQINKQQKHRISSIGSGSSVTVQMNIVKSLLWHHT